MTILFAGSPFAQHQTSTHPESPERCLTLLASLAEAGLSQRCRPGTLVSANQAQLEAVHTPTQIAKTAALARSGGGWLDTDTYVSPQSFEVAQLAAGTACAAVDAVLLGPARSALALIRPPGHHARKNTAMGFCLLNNVAIAAEQAIRQHQLERVLIVDWDVHHGNGTQDIFYDRGDVAFASVHRSPFYPGTGSAEETGTGAGLGLTFNLPLPLGTPRRALLDQFERLIRDAAARIRPQLVLVSAGFDAHRLDPIGSLGLETEDFVRLTEIVQGVAEEYAGGKLVSLLEGGYHLSALADSVAAHLTTLLQADQAPGLAGLQ